ncbi:MAG: hypothetical protein PHN57_00850 [Candidatus Omnitrophica bacterium]|nr:hypothetical protein [Candidatus Omnitrophota bacterium]
MKKFAFLVIPSNTEQLRHYWPLTRIIPDFALKSFLKTKRSFEVLHLCSHENGLEGYIFVLPAVVGNISAADTDFLLDKISAAANLAQRMGIKILGTDINIGLGLERLALKTKKKKPAITCGNAFTAWSIFESVYRTAKSKDMDLKKSAVCLSDASTPTAMLAARKFSSYVSRIILNGASKEKLESLKNSTQQENSAQIIIEENMEKAAKNADILIFDETAVAKSSACSLKTGCIICELTPNNCSTNRNHIHNEISVIKGNIIKLPTEIRCNANFGLPRNTVSSALAETILLALEGKFVNYSFGDNINPDKLEEIADIATRHGFEVWLPEAPLL